jgi:thiol-disulfide isomerase/thioredoxin
MNRLLISALQAALLVALTGIHSSKADAPAGTNTLPSEPMAAWAEVEKVHMALRSPADWRNKPPTPEEKAEFQNQVRTAAFSFAAKAREFVQRFPTNENAGDARITVVYALSHAVAVGDAASEQEIERYVAVTLADPTIPENERVGVFLMAGNVTLLKQAGLRWFTEGQSKFHEEMDRVAKARVREAMKKFPNSDMVYQFLVALAQRSERSEQKQIATEILQSPGAPESVKTLAQHYMNGTRPYQVGQPVELRFTALDGAEVDLAKLKGKVVLIEFWSTECGPCVAGMPEVKAVYEKFHDGGFEVIGISLDDKEGALRRFLKEKSLPWPQHFDGKGWGNQWAVRYGIFGIPTMWLIDKSGKLHADNARFNLEGQVAALLKESR